jgi:hypothetical protein
MDGRSRAVGYFTDDRACFTEQSCISLFWFLYFEPTLRESIKIHAL